MLRKNPTSLGQTEGHSSLLPQQPAGGEQSGALTGGAVLLQPPGDRFQQQPGQRRPHQELGQVEFARQASSRDGSWCPPLPATAATDPVNGQGGRGEVPRDAAERGEGGRVEAQRLHRLQEPAHLHCEGAEACSEARGDEEEAGERAAGHAGVAEDPPPIPHPPHPFCFAEMKTYLITFVRTCDTATYKMEESAFIFSTSVPAYSLHIFLHALHWDLLTSTVMICRSS